MSETQADERRVLVIDDSPLILEITALMLEDAGWEVRGRPSAFGLEEEIGEFRPHVILLDLGMPSLTVDALPELIAGYRNAGALKVVLHSGRSAEELEEIAQGSGADGYMVKTGDEEQMIEDLEGWLPASG